MKNHLKRISAPKTWKINRQENTFVIRPTASGHQLGSGLPLGVILRDFLKLVNTTSEVKKLLASDELEVVSAWQNCEAALKRFSESDKIRLLDILFCEGGCVNGPGIVSNLTHEQRRERIINFWGGGEQNLWQRIKQIFVS